MITQEFLQSCTDEQINKGVAWLEIVKLSKMLPVYSVNRGDISSGASIGLINTDYCANPNDAWPIMITNDIEVSRRRGIGDRLEYIACSGLIRINNTNPLRAICEVYILIEANK